MLDYAAYQAAARRSYFQQDPTFQALMRAQLSPAWHDWAMRSCPQAASSCRLLAA